MSKAFDEYWAGQCSQWSEITIEDKCRAKDAWDAALTYRPDCLTCKNRGKVYELSQEMYCEHCKWDGPAEDHYESV